MALESTQPLTEMSARNTFWVLKVASAVLKVAIAYGWQPV
jgi:hypothetical protein